MEHPGQDGDSFLVVPSARLSSHSAATSSAPEVEECEDLEVAGNESETNVAWLTAAAAVERDGEGCTKVERLRETRGGHGQRGGYVDSETESGDGGLLRGSASNSAVGKPLQQSVTQTRGFRRSPDSFESPTKGGDEDTEVNDNEVDVDNFAENRHRHLAMAQFKESAGFRPNPGGSFESSANCDDDNSNCEDKDDALAAKSTVASSRQTSVPLGQVTEVRGQEETQKNLEDVHDFDDDDDDDDDDDIPVIPTISTFTLLAAAGSGDHSQQVDIAKPALDEKDVFEQENKTAAVCAAEVGRSFYGASSDEADDDDDVDKVDDVSSLPANASDSFDKVYRQNRETGTAAGSDNGRPSRFSRENSEKDVAEVGLTDAKCRGINSLSVVGISSVRRSMSNDDDQTVVDAATKDEKVELNFSVSPKQTQRSCLERSNNVGENKVRMCGQYRPVFLICANIYKLSGCGVDAAWRHTT